MTNRDLLALVESSAPGKLVLSGEYAVLDGAPAICMAVNRRANVKIEATGGDHHTVSACGLSPDIGQFRSSNGNPEWLAAGEDFALVDQIWRAVEARPETGLTLELDTSAFVDARSGVKIGIGSSAALAVALTAALCEISASPANTESAAHEAHRAFQGGRGSGVDVACSFAGGVIEYRRGDTTSPRVKWPQGLYCTMLWSGVPAATSGKLEQLGKCATLPSRAALADAADRVAGVWRSATVDAILNEYREYTMALRTFSDDHDLGIFAAGHAGLTDAAETAGLVYKPCGAGGGDVGVVFGDDAAAIAAFIKDAVPAQMMVLDMSMDPNGVHVAGKKH